MHVQRLLLLFFLSFLVFTVEAQNRCAFAESRLREMAKETAGLNEKVDLSVNGVTIQDFIRGLASANNLNVNIDPALNVKIHNHFSNVTVLDVLLFLCEKYELEITFIGSIISFSSYTQPPPQPVKYEAKPIKITFDKSSGLLSLDLRNDSLHLVAKELTRATQNNVIFSPDLNGKLLSGYIENMPLAAALDKLAFANDLKVSSTEDHFFIIEKKDREKETATAARTASRPDRPNAGGIINTPGLSLKLDEGKLFVDAINTPIADVIAAASAEVKNNYFLFTDIKGTASLKISNVTYDEFLKYLLNGTDYTFRKEGEIYLIGDRNLEGLRATRVVPLKFRTVDKMIDIIPPDLKKGVDIKPFPDLNSFILSGSQPRIHEIETFLRDIDRVVPVVQIEVLIVDVRNSKTVSAGIEAHLGTAPQKTGGEVYPGLNITLGAATINDIISGINGFGLVNLGKVTPNFYMKLKALESQGVLKLRSTPKLATLNGHEAKMSIGKTEYYLEVSNNVIGSQNPQNIITQQYKSVNADLSVMINPMVSGDEQITLDIKVKQSNFTERISPSAPPGTISRDFQSLIRVKNDEMIILGGLEENTSNDSGSGVPLLSRIPVIKWLFSNRTKARSKSKLTIFIKPTVIY